MAKSHAKGMTTANPGVKVQQGKKPVGYDASTTATKSSGATKQSMATKKTIASSGNNDVQG